ncbi:MAG: sensor histidine kinase [Spirochaetaceae bacterium]|nr:MAG: sensor histidine kinase [Spirochaetaceae bacterium]
MTPRTRTGKLDIADHGFNWSRFGAVKYKRLTILLLLFWVLVFGWNLTRLIQVYGSLAVGVRNPNFFLPLFFVVLFALLFAAGAKKWTMAVQAVAILLMGYSYILFSGPNNVGGEIVTVFAGFLMYKYRLLDRRPIMKIALMVAGVFISYAISGFVVFRHQPGLGRYSLHPLLVAVGALLLWIIFEEDFQKLRSDHVKLEKRLQMDRPFIEFGKNAAGLVHDFKNDLGLISAFVHILKTRAESQMPIGPDDVAALNRYVERLEDRINVVRYATSARDVEAEEMINLNRLVSCVEYVFRVNPEFRRRIEFVIVPAEKPLYFGSRTALLHILENLVRNSCEALIETVRSYRPARVTITVETEPDDVRIIVADTGPGISFCLDCDAEDCMKCGVFDIGVTSKPDGSGFGLYNVQRFLAEIGGTMQVFSDPDKGTTTVVHLGPANVRRPE